MVRKLKTPKWLKVFSVFLFLLLLGSYTNIFALFDGDPYSPGETLDPECTPGFTNCTVLFNYITDGNTGWDNSYGYITASDSIANITGGAGGQILYQSASGVTSKLPNGTVGQVLTSAGGTGAPGWTTLSGGGMVYPGAGIAVSTGSAWDTSIVNNSANWNTAFGWGDHSIAGYVTGTPWTALGYITDGNTGWDNSYGFITAETSHADVVVDGDFISQGIMLRGATSGTYSILTDNSANWNTAFGWGDHSIAGYVTGTPWTALGYITDGNTGWDNSYGFITDGNTGWDNSYGFITSSDGVANITGGAGGQILYQSASGVTSKLPNGTVGQVLTSAGGTGAPGWTTLSGGGMVYPGAGIAVSTGSAWDTSIVNNSANWNTAYGWGDHSIAGYVTGTPWTALGYITDGNTGWDNSYGFITDGNTGWDNSYGFITGISSLDVTTALGFTPYNATNPSGFITSSGTATNFSGSLAGDVTGTQGVTVVGDDSHAHTASTISGLSVSDFTSNNISNWNNDSGYITSSSLSGYWNSSNDGLGSTLDADLLDGHDTAYFQVAGSYLTSSNISDTVYGAGWDGDTTNAPSKNAVYDVISNLPGGHDSVTLGTANGLSLSGQQLSLALASTSTTGALSDIDWDTFNNKAPALTSDQNYVTDAELTVIGNTSGTNTGDNAPNSSSLSLTGITDTKEMTGFINPSGIDVSYNYTNRTVTLTGNLDYYWRGVKYTLASPWTSSAHTNTVGSWFLSTVDGTNFTWSNDTWDFADIQVALVNRQATAGASFVVRETHGTMDSKAHEEFHAQVGTYRASGGQLTSGTYTENTASDAANSPGFDAGIIKDEDLSTSIPVWSEGTYTTMYIGAGSTAVFDTAASLPFTASGSYIRVNDTTTGAMADGINNRYYNVYQVMIPVGSDSDSQKYRMVMVQPQSTFTSLSSAIGEDVRNLRFGYLSNLSNEFITYSRITYYTASGDANTGKVRIPVGGVTYVLGNRVGQVSVSGFVASNHSALSNLSWLFSGHIGTASTIPGFDISGNATELTLSGTGTQLALTTAPSFTTSIATPIIELGHATDTTLARVSSGVVSIEGSNIITSSTIGSQTVNYSYNSGDADTVDGYHAASFVTGTPWTSMGYITDGNSGWDNSYGYITDGNSGWDNSYGFITSAGTSTNFSGSLAGDVTGTQGVTVVGDDSHAHTASTISGLSVSDFTSNNISNWNNDSGYITDGNTNWNNSYNLITLASISATAPVSYSNTTGVISMAQASGGTNGYLSFSDWSNFNSAFSQVQSDAAEWWDGYNYRLTSATGTSPLSLTLSSNALTGSIVANSIGDTELAYNTGQNLTTASSPTFASLSLAGNLTFTTQASINSLYQLNSTQITMTGSGAGTVVSDSSGKLSVSSDEKLKNIVGFYEEEGSLEKIISLNPINYRWNELSGSEMENVYTGFSAQNVQKFIPEAVGMDSRGYLTLSDRPIIATMVNAFKELNLKVKDMSSLDVTSATSLGALMKNFLADMNNQITDLYASVIHSNKIETQELCVGSVCVTEEEFLQIVENSNTEKLNDEGASNEESVDGSDGVDKDAKEEGTDKDKGADDEGAGAEGADKEGADKASGEANASI